MPANAGIHDFLSKAVTFFEKKVTKKTSAPAGLGNRYVKCGNRK
jgi:hypothetical protein